MGGSRLRHRRAAAYEYEYDEHKYEYDEHKYECDEAREAKGASWWIMMDGVMISPGASCP